VSKRTSFTGSALNRLLARLADVETPECKQAFADRLSQWLDWTNAISLSNALSGSLTGAANVPSRSSASPSAEEVDCARVRAALAKAIAEDARAASMEMTADFSPHRRRYFARQQAIETSIGPLRARLRARLAAASPAMAQLAAVDGVMEQTLGAHERTLLSSVPVLLQGYFERLRQADLATSREPGRGVTEGKWPEVFCKDMQDVLLAELDIRFQPVDGLLDALRVK
jgi:hypothetical protein